MLDLSELELQAKQAAEAEGAKGEYASRLQYLNIANAASQLISLEVRRKEKEK